jgi:hypothetical protein
MMRKLSDELIAARKRFPGFNDKRALRALRAWQAVDVLAGELPPNPPRENARLRKINGNARPTALAVNLISHGDDALPRVYRVFDDGRHGRLGHPGGPNA